MEFFKMHSFKNLVQTALGVVIFLFSCVTEATLVSEIFTYDDPVAARNLHVSLPGTGCQMRSLEAADLPFYQTLFSNATVMSKFGDGQTRALDATATRVQGWTSRFQQGQPHGSLTIFDPETQERLGHIIAGGGDAAGVSEIAFALMPENWGKKLATHAATALVNHWVPEVRRIGLGIGLDAIQDAPIMAAFKCFGGRLLERLDATASPANPGSWKIFDRLNFQPAAMGVANVEPVLDLDHQEFSSFQGFEDTILKAFGPLQSHPLQAGIRYRLLDTEGRARTFSKHTSYDRLKYHFEKSLTDLA